LDFLDHLGEPVAFLGVMPHVRFFDAFLLNFESESGFFLG